MSIELVGPKQQPLFVFADIHDLKPKHCGMIVLDADDEAFFIGHDSVSPVFISVNECFGQGNIIDPVDICWPLTSCLPGTQLVITQD
jgi:hypothetical protein